MHEAIRFLRSGFYTGSGGETEGGVAPQTVGLVAERDELMLHDGPDDLVVQVRIAVREPVTEAGDLPPRYRGREVADVNRQFLHRLTHDLKAAESGIVRPRVFQEPFVRQAFAVPERPARVLHDVVQVEAPVTRPGSAPSPRRGGRGA